jgi:hypothetical protein
LEQPHKHDDSGIGTVKLLGFTVSGVVPVSDLPSEGSALANTNTTFGQSLAPPNPGNTEISDFATDSCERCCAKPATMSLLGARALIAFGLLRRKRTRSVITGRSPDLQ